jgi:hypothetical protein
MAAMVSLIGAVGIGAVAWLFLGRAADSGVQRLDRLDRMRALCTAQYALARSLNDTMRVDRMPLPDTIDAQSNDRIARCGALRATTPATTLPNAREMNGQPMPRGLR